MKILAITFEPNDTARALAVHELLRAELTHLEAKVLVGDNWQVARKSASRDLQELASSLKSEYLTLKKPLIEGLSTEKKDDSSESLGVLSSELPIFHSSKVLQSADHFFSNYERTYYPPLSPAKRCSLFLSIFGFLDKTLTVDPPDFVWCVGSNYLAKATVASLCRAKGIRFKALVFSRVANIHFWSENIGVGADSHFKEGRLGLSGVEIQAGRELRESLRESLLSKRSQSIYRSELFLRSLTSIAPKAGLKQRLVTLIDFAKTVFRVFSGSRDYHPFAKRNPYLSRPVWRSVRFEFLGQFRLAAYSLLGLPGGSTKVPEGPYFAYALHQRPESSTLTLGAGTDDDEAIAFISRRMPLGHLLAVKENPSMVRDRPKSFYRQLQKLPNVVIVDPLVSTPELILGSLGTLGVSGTALLESEILGVPALSLGLPEFDVAISDQGFDSVTKWLVDRTRGLRGSDADSLDRYFGVLLKQGMRLSLGAQRGSSEFEDEVGRLTSSVLEEITKR